MVKFFTIISLFFAIIGNFAFGATSAPTCGFNKQCPDGLACVGATGTANNGVCVLTGPQIALCKTVLYFDKNLVNVFAIFAIVMIGLAFFLGKISWGMIISVILGIAIAKGAVSIVSKVSGQDEGYCTSDIVNYSVLINKDGSNGAGCISDIRKISDTPYIYNRTDPQLGTVCAEPISCYKHKCSIPAELRYLNIYAVVNSEFTGFPVGKGGANGDEAELFLPNSSSLQFTTAKSQSEYSTGRDANNQPIKTISATNCQSITATPKQDYFSCINGCTNVKFGHVYDVGKYVDCKAIVAAQ